MIPAHFNLAFAPIATPEAVVSTQEARFTMLTSRLIRLEYQAEGRFEDRPSQLVWFREQQVPDFTVQAENGRVEIETAHLHLRYCGGPFTTDSLQIVVKSTGITWQYGDEDSGNLKGTTRTLDEVSGSTRLGAGLLSRNGWVLVDDSDSLVFDEVGWLERRRQSGVDAYFLGYGRDYRACLQAYCQIAGSVPLLPRWSLGNWWSRYWAYSADELKALMLAFQQHGVPLSVCIVDMDWHLTDVGDYEGVSWIFAGWTGYTWNRDLFPDPDGFIQWLHEQGLKTSLNLHPADGVLPHEAMYPEMAQRLGIDPASKQPVLFDIPNRNFAIPYFELLHHPEEARGVDFWWTDWQQGTQSSVEGLDPLWWLNHLHFYDLGRDGVKRPFIFSRWGGLGNHRYPIGFSGDTHVNWPTLDFQPYFTATAANVGYGWWSHDIGGHMAGEEAPELYARWVQYGVFSPILRLHSTKNAFHERRPWAYDAEVFRVTRDAMQLRHALIPYLYTMSWRNHVAHLPPIRPLYHDYPEAEAAYLCPHVYTFGSELIAAPFTMAADADTKLSRQVVWLPPGEWYHFFTGEFLAGDRWHVVYGRLADIPVFAKAGAIVPLAPKMDWGGVENPHSLDIHVFAGADNVFALYEDDGETTAYLRGESAQTTIRQRWHGQQEMVVTIAGVAGDITQVPAERVYTFTIYGIHNPDSIVLLVDDVKQDISSHYDAGAETLYIGGLTLLPTNHCHITLKRAKSSLLARRERTVEKVAAMLGAFALETHAKSVLLDEVAQWMAEPQRLSHYALSLTQSQTRALFEVTQQAGVHHIANQGVKDLIILWNYDAQAQVQYQLTEWKDVWPHRGRFGGKRGDISDFEALMPQNKWQLVVNLDGVITVRYEGDGYQDSR